MLTPGISNWGQIESVRAVGRVGVAVVFVWQSGPDFVGPRKQSNVVDNVQYVLQRFTRRKLIMKNKIKSVFPTINHP